MAPSASTNVLYEVCRVPAGSEVVAMVSTAFNVIVSVVVMLEFAIEVAVTVAVAAVEILAGAV